MPCVLQLFIAPSAGQVSLFQVTAGRRQKASHLFRAIDDVQDEVLSTLASAGRQGKGGAPSPRVVKPRTLKEQAGRLIAAARLQPRLKTRRGSDGMAAAPDLKPFMVFRSDRSVKKFKVGAR